MLIIKWSSSIKQVKSVDGVNYNTFDSQLLLINRKLHTEF